MGRTAKTTLRWKTFSELFSFRSTARWTTTRSDKRWRLAVLPIRYSSHIAIFLKRRRIHHPHQKPSFISIPEPSSEFPQNYQVWPSSRYDPFGFRQIRIVSNFLNCNLRASGWPLIPPNCVFLCLILMCVLLWLLFFSGAIVYFVSDFDVKVGWFSGHPMMGGNFMIPLFPLWSCDELKGLFMLFVCSSNFLKNVCNSIIRCNCGVDLK